LAGALIRRPDGPTRFGPDDNAPSQIGKNRYLLDNVEARYLPTTLKVAGFVSSGVAFG
jgi:hypothetical protein